MTDNNQQIDAIEKVESGPKHSGKRRTLMKGAAAAVPVVLTLRSGATFANTSNLSCIVNGVVSSSTKVLVDEPDGIVRQLVSCIDVVGLVGSATVLFKAYSENINDQVNVSTVWQNESNIGNGDVTYSYNYDLGTDGTGTDPVYGTYTDPVVDDISGNIIKRPLVGNNGITYEQKGSSYGALINVNFREDGTINSIGLPSTTDEGPVMESCQTSFAPGSTNPINI